MEEVMYILNVRTCITERMSPPKNGFLRKKSIYHNLMLIKVEEKNETEDCQALLFFDKKGTQIYLYVEWIQ